MLLELNQLHFGKVFHQNILNRATFCQRVELRDQGPKEQTSLGKTTILFGTETLKHKIDIFAEKAKNSEDIRLLELEKCKAFKWFLSGLVVGYLKTFIDQHIVVGSLRNSFPLLYSHANQFIMMTGCLRQLRLRDGCDCVLANFGR